MKVRAREAEPFADDAREAEPFAEDAREWGLSPRAAHAALLVPLVGAALVAALRLHLPAFRFLTQEDGPLEWPQALAFFGCAALGASNGIRLLHRGERIAGALWLGFAAACFFIGGEEIAWGQRLLGIETPEAFEEINEQGETTIHNIRGLLGLFNLGMLAVGVYGAVSPFAARRLAVPQPWRRLFVPPMALATSFALAATFRVARLTVIPDSFFTATKWGEWTELCLGGALFVFSLLVWRRERSG